MNFFQALEQRVRAIVVDTLKKRAVKDVDEWDGSAANYDDTAAYCSACLIDVNPAGEDKKQSLCMLPVRGPGDEADTYVRQAVHAAAGGHGISAVEKPEGVEQEAWDAAKKSAAKKLVAAYKEMDEDAPEAVMDMADMSADEERSAAQLRAIGSWDLRDQVQVQANEKFGMDAWAWVSDIYHDNGGEVFAVIAYEGKLYRAPVTIENDAVTVGDTSEVVVEFRPSGAAGEEEEGEAARARTRYTVQRQADGKMRWFATSCSAVLNRVGEIDSRDLFDSFIAKIEETGEYPYRCFYHLKEQFRTGQCDFVARDGNLLITSGVYDDSDLARAEIAARMASPETWGDSISYWATEPELVEVAGGIRIPVYRSGILEEISTAPESDVAALYTGGTLKKEERRMLTGKSLEAFVALWGGDEDRAKDWLESNVDASNRAIESEGQIARTAPAETLAAPPAESPAAPAAPAQPGTVEIDEAATSAIARAIASDTAFQETLSALVARQLEPIVTRIDGTTRSIQEMSGRHTKAVKGLEDRLGALELDEDEKKRAWQSDLPAASRLQVTYRPREKPAGEAEPTYADRASETLAAMGS